MFMYAKCFKRQPVVLGKVFRSQPVRRTLSDVKIISEAKQTTDQAPMTGTTPCVVPDQSYPYKEGKMYHGFECEHVEYNPDYDLTSCMLRHTKTGTKLWYLDRKDINNLFSINFRTPSFDSSGVAHILEHMTLCGSKNFPVSDSFFKMLNRSVATNMNALTDNDYTIYPFSTRNEVDFRNLQRIYLDAVFKPTLSYLNFLQEGWRLEHTNLHDRQTDLMFKGAVYNEMKGNFSENSRLFKSAIFRHILPCHSYKHIGGGDPLVIPKLSHSDLVEYHRKYYHPSNARIFCYGSFDLMQTLALIDKDYLYDGNFKDPAYSCVPPQPRWTEEREEHITGRVSNLGASLERQNQIGIGVLMSDRTEVQETFELTVLAKLLIHGPNSSFYKSLVEPNFSGGFNKTTGYFTSSRDTYFVVGLQDLRLEDFDTFKDLYNHTVQESIDNGFEEQHIESILHNIELIRKRQSPQLGRNLLYQSMCLWNHDGDVVANLKFSKMIDELRLKLKKNPKYLQDKMEKYFVDSSHQLLLTMSPDEHYEEKEREAETELLIQKVNYLSPDNLNEICENNLMLEAEVNAKRNADLLPCLTLNDVKDPLKSPIIKETTVRGVPTQLCVAATNGITYLNCMFNITQLSLDEIILVPLLSFVIKSMETQAYGFEEFNRLVQLKTAGMKFVPKVLENVQDGKSYHISLIMSTHALDKNVPDMFALCQELLLNFKLKDINCLKMLVENYISNISCGIANNGHLYAIMGSTSLVTDAAKLRSLLCGIDHINFMKKYVQEFSTEEIADRLTNLGAKIFSKGNMRVAINSTEAGHTAAVEPYSRFVDSLPIGKRTNAGRDLNLLGPSFQHFYTNTALNYCAKSFFAVPYLHEDHPALRVLVKLLTAKYIMPVVRAQNGAYGAGVKIGFDGMFNFYSYRDPHSTKTLEVFDKSYDWLHSKNDELDDQSILEAKLGVMQLVDWHNGAGELGLDYFMHGVSQEQYEVYRKSALAVTAYDLRRVIEIYLKEKPLSFGKCIIGPKQEVTEKESSPKLSHRVKVFQDLCVK